MKNNFSKLSKIMKAALIYSSIFSILSLISFILIANLHWFFGIRNIFRNYVLNYIIMSVMIVINASIFIMCLFALDKKYLNLEFITPVLLIFGGVIGGILSIIVIHNDVDKKFKNNWLKK